MGLFTLTRECEDAIERWSGEVGRPSAEARGVERIRVFENRFIEDWFATAHPIVPGLWTIPSAIACAWFGWQWAGAAATLGLFVVGAIGWTLLEYVLHRWLFHRRPSSWHFDKVQMFMLHGYHHEYPNDPWRLVAPPIMAWPVTLIVTGIYVGVLGWAYALPLLGGTMMGYLAYDWTHFYEHHAKPKTALGKWLRRLHSLHHFDDPEYNHGISGPLWDFVFFTYRDASRKQAERGQKDASEKAA
ncbi:MAG: sterol desaturase family protein [Alphaproteobacteria bacterium]|nr:sterol desaturase family protein [Alphaproteobacteria bacterium]